MYNGNLYIHSPTDLTCTHILSDEFIYSRILLSELSDQSTQITYSTDFISKHSHDIYRPLDIAMIMRYNHDGSHRGFQLQPNFLLIPTLCNVFDANNGLIYKHTISIV